MVDFDVPLRRGEVRALEVVLVVVHDGVLGWNLERPYRDISRQPRIIDAAALKPVDMIGIGTQHGG